MRDEDDIDYRAVVFYLEGWLREAFKPYYAATHPSLLGTKNGLEAVQRELRAAKRRFRREASAALALAEGEA